MPNNIPSDGNTTDSKKYTLKGLRPPIKAQVALAKSKDFVELTGAQLIQHILWAPLEKILKL